MCTTTIDWSGFAFGAPAKAPAKIDMTDYSTWTTDRLKDLEEYLYDREVEGDDTWYERDQILNELNRRTL